MMPLYQQFLNSLAAIFYVLLGVLVIVWIIAMIVYYV